MHRLFSALALTLAFATTLPAENGSDWPQFLGPRRNGISQETGLLNEWPRGGPKEVWRIDGGQGMSGIAIRNGRLYTMYQDVREQYVICRNAKTGESIWKAAVAPSYRNGQGNGPRATPTVTKDTVFAFTGQGILVSLNSASGAINWSSNLVKLNDGRDADYGMACSPLLVGDRVVVTIGAPKATVVAVDAKSGKIAWKAGRDLPAGYSSPALLKVGGQQQLVVFSGSAALGLEPANGKSLWSYDYRTNYECNVATPVAIDGDVFISAGENQGSVRLQVAKKNGEWETDERWSSSGVNSVMRNEWQTSVLLDGYLYGFDNVGGAGPISHLTCVKAANGERAWQETRFGKGNHILADGKLFISTIRGELVIAKATPKRYEEIGRKAVLGFTRQAPALAHGLLYLRDDDVIVCLDIRKPND